MVTNCPPFGTQGRLTLDIDIALYLIAPIFILVYLFYTSGYPREKEHQEEAGVINPQRLVNVTTGPVGISSLLHSSSRAKTMRALLDSTIGSTSHFIKGIKVNCRI